MDASTWANVIAGLALFVAVATLVLSRRDVSAARRSASDADERAERATTAAEQAAAAQKDMVDRLPKPAVRWEAVHRKGDTFEVRNVGQRSAFNVDLSFTREHVMGHLTEEVPSPWEPGISVGLLAAGTLDSGTPVLEVTWEDEAGGERRRWTSMLTS